MKIVKWIFGILIGLFLIALLIGFLMPGKISFEVNKTLNAKQNKIYSNINEFRNWEKWSEWHKMDENMKIKYPTKTSGKGGSYSWTSEDPNVGNGKMIITKSNLNHISYDMDFGENGDAKSYFKLKPNGNKTDVIWGFDSDIGNNPFMKLMFNLLFVKEIKKSYHKSLNSLEKVSK